MIWSQNELMHWIEKAEKPPRKFKVKISGSELMATVFWDCELILFIKYLFKNTTINEDYYAALLTKVRQVVVEKKRSKHVKEILFLQDNAPVNTA